MLTSMITISYCYILLATTYEPFKTLLDLDNHFLSEHYLNFIAFKPKITNLKFAYNLGFSLGKRLSGFVTPCLNHPTPYSPLYFV